VQTVIQYSLRNETLRYKGAVDSFVMFVRMLKVKLRYLLCREISGFHGRENEDDGLFWTTCFSPVGQHSATPLHQSAPSNPTRHLLPILYKTLKNAHTLRTLKIATVMFVETLDNFQDTSRLISANRSCLSEKTAVFIFRIERRISAFCYFLSSKIRCSHKIAADVYPF
jgi:hypothetical protein